MQKSRKTWLRYDRTPNPSKESKLRDENLYSARDTRLLEGKVSFKGLRSLRFMKMTQGMPVKPTLSYIK